MSINCSFIIKNSIILYRRIFDMAFVKVDNTKKNGLEIALKIFKKQCNNEGIIGEVKDRQEYVSKSLKRRIKSKAARIKLYKKIKKKLY